MSEFEEVKASLLAWQEDLQKTQIGMDTFWVLFGGCLVFLMQCGFGMLEAGSVSSRNVVAIMYRNLLSTCTSAVLFFCCGWAFAFGETGNRFIGESNFFLRGLPDTTTSVTSTVYTGAKIFFQFSLCTTSATIVSGALAERTQDIAYASCWALFSSIIFPLAAHWCWSSSGWASATLSGHEGRIGMGVFDFAGATTVFVLGGFAALAGAIVLGPRKRSYRGKKISRFSKGDEAKESILFAGHNKVYQVMGIMILWAGWFGLNLASTGTLHNRGSRIAPRIAINTALAASGGGFAVIIADSVRQVINRGDKMKERTPSVAWKTYADRMHLVTEDIPDDAFAGYSLSYDLRLLCNGILCGLVSSAAGCAVIEPWASLIVSFVTGLVYTAVSKLLRVIQIDDPLDAFAIYGCSGLVSLILTAFFAKPAHVDEVYGVDFTRNGYYGIFYGGDVNQLGVQVAVGLTVAVWSFSLNLLLFLSLCKIGRLRLPDSESTSQDAKGHHVRAYH
eukprot:TRINITY_DN17733_c3_g1_i1.p1 TRINITY_DN17733_c3_g1~~TRINITY_DN17733_c3_g1_i1.p1  ORF type:complete len:525 (+),score=58.62 TRINITY_DN17733_c3_g1_i1:65-1576(+)